MEEGNAFALMISRAELRLYYRIDILDNPMTRQIKSWLIILVAIFCSEKAKACVCVNPFMTIDSLAQLREYDFIAHVKIIDDKDFKKANQRDPGTAGELTVEVLELFKGEKIDKIIEYSKHTSCNIGIAKGEEWILFGRLIEGKISVIACDRNEQYRAIDGLRDWKYDDGFYELRQLRKLYKHPVKTFQNETCKEFYTNGQIEIEEIYKDGKLNGARKIWYPNGVLFCRQYYVNDSLDGKSEWFYQSGQIYDEDYYQMGKLCNVSRLYYDSTINAGWKRHLIDMTYKTEDSLNFVYKRVQVQYEIVFDSYGRAVVSREYTRLGKIHKEELNEPDRKFTTVIYYHDNGAISSIMYSLNGRNYGHYQTYDENGFPDQGWDYDENGNMIRRH